MCFLAISLYQSTSGTKCGLLGAIYVIPEEKKKSHIEYKYLSDNTEDKQQQQQKRLNYNLQF